MGGQMKVALELQPCCGKRSGIGIYTYELAKRLADGDGLEFCGNLFNFMGRNDNSESLKDITMPIRESRIFPYGVYRRIWDWIPISYKSLFPGEADLSVFFNYIVPPRIGGKVITAIHDMTWLRFPETMDRRNYRRLQDGLVRSVERSDRILTLSRFSKREIVSLLGVPDEKISIVPCAPSLSKAVGDFPLCAERFHIRRPYLLYVGTIEPRKNLVRLLKAYSLLKKEQGIAHQLVLAGGRGWEADEIYRTAEHTDGVILTGYLTTEEKNALYQNAAAFVFPSIYEGFGIPPLEAMAFGCPVVCSNAASLPEVVGEAARLVGPLDEMDIAQGIWDVLSDEAYADRLRAEGYRQAEKYSWDASAKKLAKICGAVLEES